MSNRSLEELQSSSDILSGAESQMLRTFCTSEYMSPPRDLNDRYGRLLANGDLNQFQAYFNSRVQSLSVNQNAAAQELYQRNWGPTKIPIYNVLLSLIYMQPPMRSKYLALADWLAKTAKVPVDGTDLSGTTALMHSISTKPYLDTDFAKLLLEAGGDINHRNRFGCTTAHDFVRCYQFDSATQEKSSQALKLFLENRGDIDIKDGDGMSARYMLERMSSLVPRVAQTLSQFEQDNSSGGNNQQKETNPSRNAHCPCGSSRKYKKCCGA